MLSSIHNFLQEALLKNWIEVHTPPKLAKLESIFKENNGGDGWLVGDDVSSLDTKNITTIRWIGPSISRYVTKY